MGLEEWVYKGYLDLIVTSQSKDAVCAIINPHGGVCMGLNVFGGSTGHFYQSLGCLESLDLLHCPTSAPTPQSDSGTQGL